MTLKNVTTSMHHEMPGSNGVGKSTLMRILATMQEPGQGSVCPGSMGVVNQKKEVTL